MPAHHSVTGGHHPAHTPRFDDWDFSVTHLTPMIFHFLFPAVFVLVLTHSLSHFLKYINYAIISQLFVSSSKIYQVEKKKL